MLSEPPLKRTFVFIDGQNLLHAAKEAFGYSFPNYDVAALARRVCLNRAGIWYQAHTGRVHVNFSRRDHRTRISDESLRE